MNRYKCFSIKKSGCGFVYANNPFEAQKKYAKENNIKKSYDVSVVKCNEEGNFDIALLF